MTEYNQLSAEFSRRSVLYGAACAVAAGPALAVALSADPANAAGKMSQSAAKYQPTPKGDQRCDGCALWEAPNGCKVVSGTIAPEAWCKLYVPKPK
jgi:hypothetical protein